MEQYVADHVIRIGQGEPMLLIHGLGHRKEAWDPVLPALGGRFDVAAADLPGFGGADPLAEAPTDGALADHCEALMDAMGWDTAHLVGNSLGGLIALRLGSRGRARSVTALSPGGQMVGWEQTWARAVLRLNRTIAPHALRVPALSDTAIGRRIAMASVFGRPERMNRAYARLSIEGLAQASAFEAVLDCARWQVDDVADIPAPVTIAWGSRDWLLLPRQGVRWATALGDGARLVKLAGLGHTPMPDDPDVVVDVIVRTAARATSRESAASHAG
ncbi:alpha/beta fold hydrolase [Euzebya sp.]|uniref:alpha/beta fold hydrolase n=1 Tax=Euzebya sp. TaxID=1971409 RepID=UPI00351390F8